MTPSVSAHTSDEARLEVTSQPTGAMEMLDGHSQEKTPLMLPVALGGHVLVLKHPDALDDQRQISVVGDMHMSVSMWLRRPATVQLRPAYPGASIVDAAFLGDGRLGLSMAIPCGSGNQNGTMLREPWISHPATGSVTQLSSQPLSLRAAVVSVSPDGTRVAYLHANPSAPRLDSTHARLTEVWIANAADAGTAVRVFSLPASSAEPSSSVPSDVEEVEDVAWTPDGLHLRIVLRLVTAAGGNFEAPRSRLLLVDATAPDEGSEESPPVELVTLPADVVPDSYTWAPDGHWVAFFTAATTTSTPADRPEMSRVAETKNPQAGPAGDPPRHPIGL